MLPGQRRADQASGVPAQPAERQPGQQDASPASGRAARDHALVFQARVGHRQVEGCDFLRCDENGAIDELVVMIRLLSGILALAEAMKAEVSPGA